MSLETWKAEFYPIPADGVPEGEALAHSLKKWEGLRKENLKKHGLRTRFGRLGNIHIDASTCALCHHYLHTAAGTCIACPLSTVYAVNCDEQYMAWGHSRDPEPMIALIKYASNKENKA